MTINPYAVAWAALEGLDEEKLYELAILDVGMLLKTIKETTGCPDDIFFATPEVVEMMIDEVILIRDNEDFFFDRLLES